MSSPSPQKNMLLLQTKFVHPRLPSALIVRDRLLKDLNATSTHRLVLLSASAGSGKTMLLSTWATSMHMHAGQQVAWLSLDEMDNDPVRFWASVIAALNAQHHPGVPPVGDTALQMLHSPPSASIQMVLTALINEILEQTTEIILVLDDYHVISDQAIHEGMSFLLEHLPANLHLVLASRADPDLPLARWRMRGQMVEIRDTDLSFTQEETERFLSQALGYPLLTQEVYLLQRRTEGWIAGLQLAALTLRRQEDRGTFLLKFAGNHRYLMDYVQQEILEQQPFPLQRFLLQIAVLPRLNAELCQAVTGESASQEFLEILERNNLFLVPLGEQRQWYRLHDLFREILLARLQALHPQWLQPLQQRAATWYHTQGLFHEAISHALASKHFSFAATLMEQGAVQALLKAGELKTLASWAQALPAETLCAHPGLACLFARRHIAVITDTSGDQRLEGLALLDQTLALIERARAGETYARLPEPEKARISHRFHLIGSWRMLNQAFLDDDARHFLPLAEQLQPETEEDLTWKLLSIECLVQGLPFGGDLEPLRLALLDAKRLAREDQNHYVILTLIGWLEYFYLEAGQLHQTYQECLEGEALREQLGGQLTIIGHLENLADLHYRWNRLDEAERYLRSALEQAHARSDSDLLVWGYCHLVDILLAHRDVVGAEHALQEAKQLVRQRQSTFFAFMSPWTAVAQSRLFLARGDLAAAADWAAQLESAASASLNRYHKERLALARVLLAQQKHAEALRVLEPLLLRAEEGKRGWNIIEILALQIATLQVSGETDQARERLIRLLRLTGPEDVRRVYLDAGRPMQEALQELLFRQRRQEPALSAALISHARLLLAAFEHEERSDEVKEQAGLALSSQELPTSSHATVPFEPLSPQEQRVLRLLVAGRSNPEIASTLVVSVNTVKTQLQSIYRKLGVTNRVEASVAARHLRLL
ncbi:MAG TPA: LuxR C-terminal-related transcriptional regulator [Ktedonosporobacter sp.]|nr:LuxR C-terminal-related transcriptional regulator [Ktedonosporobacter sp.]